MWDFDRRRRTWFGGDGGCVDFRKEDLEGRPFARDTRDLDESSRLLHDPIRSRESESGTLPGTLRREEGLEDAIKDLRRHSSSRILDSHDRVTARRR
jgi:hypothetical protein